MRLSSLFFTSLACLVGSDAFAQVYNTGKLTSALWTDTIDCASSCTQVGTITVGKGYPDFGKAGSPATFLAGWECRWDGGVVEDLARFGLGVKESSYDPVTGDLEYALSAEMRKDVGRVQEFQCDFRLGAIGGFPSSTVDLYVGADQCAGTDNCSAGGTTYPVVPLGMEWAGVVLRDFSVETASGAGIPVDTIAVVTSSERNGTDLYVDIGCDLTDGSGVSMACETEWMSVATGPGYSWGREDNDSVDYNDIHYGVTNPYAYWPLAGGTCGQSGWYLDFHTGAVPLYGLASGYAECAPSGDSMTNTWTSWLGDSYGTTATSMFYGRHLGTALFLY